MLHAFLGTGLIGGGMVDAWLARGLSVAVWNRSADKARAFVDRGARLASTPGDAVQGAERVHLALSDDAAVDLVLEAALPELRAGALVVDHSTTSPAGAAARAERLEARGVQFLHAPVFMSPQMCREAKGLMLCSGPSAAFERAEPELSRMTGSLWWLGERADLAASYKLFGNAMILSVVGGLSDVFTLAEAVGISAPDAHRLFEKVKPGLTVDLRGARMARGDFETVYALTMARKDVRLMLEMAGDRPLAVLRALAQRMDAVIADGQGDADVGVLAAHALSNAGRARG